MPARYGFERRNDSEPPVVVFLASCNEVSGCETPPGLASYAGALGLDTS